MQILTFMEALVLLYSIITQSMWRAIVQNLLDVWLDIFDTGAPRKHTQTEEIFRFQIAEVLCW